MSQDSNNQIPPDFLAQMKWWSITFSVMDPRDDSGRIDAVRTLYDNPQLIAYHSGMLMYVILVPRPRIDSQNLLLAVLVPVTGLIDVTPRNGDVSA